MGLQITNIRGVETYAAIDQRIDHYTSLLKANNDNSDEHGIMMIELVDWISESLYLALDFSNQPR